MTDSTDQKGQHESATEQAAPAKKSRSRYWIAFLGVFIVFLAIPYWYTSNPQSCTRCHDMSKYYESWKASSHSTAASNCFECHVKQGTVSLWIYRISFYREIYASMTGAKLKPAGASEPGIKSCQRKGCHSLNRVSSSSGDLKIKHREHVKKAHLTCVQCHPGAAHPNVGKIGSLTPPRKMCKTCHAARMNDCSYCHVKTSKLSEGYKH